MALIDSNLGTVSVSDSVIAQSAGLFAMECYGIVGMATRSLRDNIVQLLRIENLAQGIKITQSEGDDKKVDIDLHVIVEMNTNITAIAESVQNTVKYKIEEQLGLSVGKINVFVEDVRVS